MNRKVLEKILEELGKEDIRLDYVRGILETVLESLPPESTSRPVTGHRPLVAGQVVEEADLIVASAGLNKVDFKSIETK